MERKGWKGKERGDHLAGFKGAYFYGEGGEREEGKGRERKTREWEGIGKGRDGRGRRGSNVAPPMKISALQRSLRLQGGLLLRRGEGREGRERKRREWEGIGKGRDGRGKEGEGEEAMWPLQ